MLVPGFHFFTDLVPVVPGTAAREFAAVAALAIEQSAPFPGEQLARGHVAAGDGTHLFAFAALRRKFAAEQDLWRAAGFVVPDFATWLPRELPGPAVVVLETGRAISALDFPAKTTIPTRVVSRPVPEGADDAAVASVREQVLARVVPGGRRVWRYRLGATPCWRAGNRYEFDWEPLEGAPAPAAGSGLTEAQLWAMDLREGDFLRTKQRDFRWNRIAWNSLVGLTALLGLLAAAELGLLGGQFWLAQKRQQIQAQAPAAQQADTNLGLVDRLDAYGVNKPQPLEMLAYVHERRPASVFFTKVSIEGASKVVLDALARNPADVNEFEAALRNSPELAGAPTVQGLRSGEGGATFQMIVGFRAGFGARPAPKPEPVSAPAAVAPESVPVQP